jgi:dUTP pyrophosphatase
MQLLVEYLDNYDKSWGALNRANPTDAGIDLRAAISKPIALMPSSYVKIPLGICTQFPAGYEAQLRARSGLAAKKGIGLVNGVGTIDAGYRGEWAVVLFNYSMDVFRINPGDRICQVVFNQIPPVDILEGPVTSDDDRGGGFGSSGVA